MERASRCGQTDRHIVLDRSRIRTPQLLSLAAACCVCWHDAPAAATSYLCALLHTCLFRLALILPAHSAGGGQRPAELRRGASGDAHPPLPGALW